MEQIKHECGVAMIRLLKPLSYYKEKYGTELYGLDRLYLIMEKEHNRGQEAAGIGCVKLNAAPGNEYIFRERAQGSGAISEIFGNVHDRLKTELDEGVDIEDASFVGEAYMGHLRYSTTGRSGMNYVHPFMRRNNWRSRNMLICGNFNMTNVAEIFDEIVSRGQHPRLYADTFILLEQLGHALDRENERLYQQFHSEGLSAMGLSEAISRDLNVANILRRCSPVWDGGYVICGIVGNGDMWAMRDPHGIRPAFYHIDDEIIVVASERPVIQTALNIEAGEVEELKPGAALIVDRNGTSRIEQILAEGQYSACSFERIYFSRGSDIDIYRERKRLGEMLVEPILKAIDYDLDKTVFSFIPNTAEVAFYGLVDGIEQWLIRQKTADIKALAKEGALTDVNISKILNRRVRREKVALKDIKLRTFIAESDVRNDLASHVYDITYGSIDRGDTLVIIDDSIVRGTTLRSSILGILDRLHPGRIVIVSSSPQVRYPDCYGIDMSRMGEFIAFKAAMMLLAERGMRHVIDDVYEKCRKQDAPDSGHIENYVKAIYAPFSDEEIACRISEMLTPSFVKAEVKIVFQSVGDMRKAIPDHRGDWYFTGDYPTPGGIRLVNKAFVNYCEGRIKARD